MKKRRRKKSSSDTLMYVGIGILAFLIVMVLVLSVTNKNNKIQSELKDVGYVTEDQDDAFYKNITTNNTITEYYDDVRKKRF